MQRAAAALDDGSLKMTLGVNLSQSEQQSGLLLHLSCLIC
jgi:hypothetical protein